MNRLTRLDAVRGIACLAIVIEHSLSACDIKLGIRFTPIFFMLSGFLLYRPVVRGRHHFNRQWFEKRIVRLIPAFWLALFVATYFSSFAGAPSVGDLLGRPGSSLPQAWSLGVEFVFYACLPLMVWVSQKTKYPHIFVIGFVSLVWLDAFLMRGWGNEVMIHTGFIAIGMAVAVAYENNKMIKLPTIPILVYVAVVGYFNANLDQDHSFAPFFLGAILGLTLLSAALVGDTRVLNSKYIKQVGTVSFGVYLWHLLAIHTPIYEYWVYPSVGWVVACGLIGSLIAGHISYYAIERPIVRLHQRRTM